MKKVYVLFLTFVLTVVETFKNLLATRYCFSFPSIYFLLCIVNAFRFGDMHASNQTREHQHYVDQFAAGGCSYSVQQQQQQLQQQQRHLHTPPSSIFDLRKHGVTITPISSNSYADPTPSSPAALDLSVPWVAAAASSSSQG